MVFAGDPLDSLPEDINAVASVDVAAIYKSSLATEQQWAKKALQSLLSNEAVVPPGVESLAVGSKMTFDDTLSSQGEYAVATVGKDLTLQKLATISGGEIDTLEGRPLLATTRGVQVVATTDSTWLIAATGGRQVAARWLRAQQTPGALGAALRNAVKQKKADEQIVIAFDLSDLFSSRELTERLSDLETNGKSVQAIAEALSTVQSVAFYISVAKDVQGRMVIQLGQSASPVGSAMPALRARLLQRVGATLPDLDGWNFHTSGNTVVGAGSLSPQGARRLLSVLNPPGILEAAAGASGDSAGDSKSRTIEASRRYLHAVRKTLDDVKSTLRDSKMNDAVWLEKAGRKIDDLPLLNVDSDLIDFAGKVSGSLRYQGQAERVSNVRGGTRKNETGAGNVYVGYSYGPYGNAWAGVGQSASTATIDAQQNEASKGVRFSEMKAIEDGYTKMRQDLTKKYEAEF